MKSIVPVSKPARHALWNATIAEMLASAKIGRIAPVSALIVPQSAN
jgi:hypothetical protein